MKREEEEGFRLNKGASRTSLRESEPLITHCPTQTSTKLLITARFTILSHCHKLAPSKRYESLLLLLSLSLSLRDFHIRVPIVSLGFSKELC